MQSFNSGDKDTLAEKIVRYAIPLGLIAIGVLTFNKVAPTIIKAFDNLTSLVGSMFAAAAVTIPAIFIILYVAQNPEFIKMTYRNICRKITSVFIKMDFLSYMDGYIETLKEKRKNLQLTKVNIQGKKVKLARMVEELLTNIDENMRKASAAKKQSKGDQAALFASMASGDKESITLYQPILQRLEKNLTFLEKLDENWGISIVKLDHEVKRKRTEYEVIREMYKGLSAAELFASDDNEKARIFKESLDALQTSVSNKIAAIEDFEKRSKGVMDGIDIEKQLMQDDGLRLLEEYEENGGLFLDSPDNATGELTIITPQVPKSTTFSKILRERNPKL